MPAKLKRPAPPQHKARHLDAVAPWSIIKHPQPGYKYVLANKVLGANVGGPEFYEMIGWDYVREGDPECFAAGKAKSDSGFVEAQGNVLMRINEEEYDRIREDGAALAGQGLASYRERMDRIIDRRNGLAETIRGIPGMQSPHGRPYVSMENDTSRLEVE